MFCQFRVRGIHAKAVRQVPIWEADEYSEHIADATCGDFGGRIAQCFEIANQGIWIARIKCPLDSIHKRRGHIGCESAYAIGGLIYNKGNRLTCLLLIKEATMFGNVSYDSRTNGKHRTTVTETGLHLANM